MGISLHNPTDGLGVCPIGSIIAWIGDYMGSETHPPTGWQECDGSEVIDNRSPYFGANLPDLNSANNMFLRGATSSAATGGAATHTHTYSGTTGSPSATVATSGTGASQAGSERHTHTYSGTTASGSSLPPYFEVIWIIRIF